jgi:hypothetical protein
MGFLKPVRILTILKKGYKLLPLFLWATSIVLLVSASVPGQLEQHKLDISLAAIAIEIFSGIASILIIPPQWVFSLILLSLIGLLIYYLYRRQQQKDRPHRWQILSLSIVIITSLLLSSHIPAKIRFYTSATEFDRVLMQQILKNLDYKPGDIGNFTILNVRAYINSESTKSKSVYFITKEVDTSLHKSRHGFAYLSNLPSARAADELGTYTHIDGKWYIFDSQKM